MLNAAEAAKLDSVTGLALLVICQLRLHQVATHSEANSRLFQVLTFTFSFCVALPPLLIRVARPFYLRHRTAIVLFSRLGAIASVVVPYQVPEPTLTTCSCTAVWNWLLNSHALTSAYLSLGFPLPIGTHLYAASLQQAALVFAAVNRCPLTGAWGWHNSSFLDLLPPHCFQALGTLLDWPFHMVAPAMWSFVGNMSPHAACLACTLWVQLLIGGLLPTVLLWVHTADIEDHHQAAGKLMHAWLGDMPSQMTLFTLQIMWMVIRTLCVRLLPVYTE